MEKPYNEGDKIQPTPLKKFIAIQKQWRRERELKIEQENGSK